MLETCPSQNWFFLGLWNIVRDQIMFKKSKRWDKKLKFFTVCWFLYTIAFKCPWASSSIWPPHSLLKVFPVHFSIVTEQLTFHFPFTMFTSRSYPYHFPCHPPLYCTSRWFYLESIYWRTCHPASRNLCECFISCLGLEIDFMHTLRRKSWGFDHWVILKSQPKNDCREYSTSRLWRAALRILDMN